MWAHTKIAETAKKKKKKSYLFVFVMFFYSEELFNRWNLFIKTINDYLSLLNIKAFIIQFCKHTYSIRMKNLMNIVQIVK